MSQATNIDLEITIGLPFVHYITLSGADGISVDPTGDTFAASMVTWMGKAAVADFTTSVSTDDDGQVAIKLALDGTATSGLSEGIVRWDCIMTDADTSDRIVIAQGNVKIYDTATTP